MRINTRHDFDYYLADASTRDAALARLQCLLDERFEWVDGVWGVNPDAPFYRLGVGVEDAVAWGCEDRAVPEPERPSAEELEAAEAIADAKSELAQLDLYIPRSVEDLIDAGVLPEASLSTYNQERLARKRALRAVIQGA